LRSRDGTGKWHSEEYDEYDRAAADWKMVTRRRQR